LHDQRHFHSEHDRQGRRGRKHHGRLRRRRKCRGLRSNQHLRHKPSVGSKLLHHGHLRTVGKGKRTADISVTNNGGGSPQKVSLSGTGT
jgi:hypothetical protein